MQKRLGVSRQAVLDRIGRKTLPKGVTAKKIGNVWILEKRTK